MSVVPRIYIEFVADGADGVTDAIGDVSDGLDDVTKSGDKAAKALDGTGKAADKAQTRGQKLWSTMKANAGAASGAAGAFASVSAILNSDMSPAAKTATGVAQGLAAGLNAFGPIGQLAGAGISALSSFLIPLIDDMDRAYEPTYTLTEQLERFGEGASFAAQTVGKMVAGFEDAGKEAERFKNRLDAGTASIYELYTATEVLRRSQQSAAIRALREEIQTRGDAAEKILATGEAGAAAIDKLFGSGSAAKAVEIGNERTAQLREQIAFQLKGLELDEEVAKKRLEGSEAKSGGKAATDANKESLDDLIFRLNAEAAHEQAAYEASLAERQAYFDSLVEMTKTRAAEVADAMSAAYYNDQINAAVMAGAEAQKGATATTLEEADALIGVYQDLTNGLGAYASAAADGFASAAASALLYGGSLKDLLNEQFQALAQQATIEAIKATATGLGYLAAGLFGFGPGLAAAQASFASAAVWAGIAGGAAIGASATGGFSSGGSGDSTGSGREPTARDLGGPSGSSANAGPTDIYVNMIAGGPITRAMAREVEVGNDMYRRRGATGG